MVRGIALLLLSALAAGCTPLPDASQPAALPPRAAPVAQKIGVLLPLTGQNAALGHELLQAVQLALGPEAPQADVRDTGGTPGGATAAVQAALANGDTVIVGPLTAPETAAVAYAAPGVPILAFTSDRNQARPYVWPLGITPQQQAQRLVQALQQAGKARIAAVLPSNPFGDALAEGLNGAAARAGDPVPLIRRYPNGSTTGLDDALRSVSAFQARGGAPVPAVPDPAAPPDATSGPLEPPPFDALMLAESGAMLRAAVAATDRYAVRPPEVQIMGPATWARDTGNLPGLVGAWYAAPDPSTRGAFEQIYTATYGTSPPGLASIAYDAAHLARLAAGSPGSLTKPGGFEGADGPIALRPDGRVVRGLAVFAVEPDGPRVIDRAASSLAGAS
jgi:ABC-type branched-subunit amino acid transport system substrate-binding protein